VALNPKDFPQSLLSAHVIKPGERSPTTARRKQPRPVLGISGLLWSVAYLMTQIPPIRLTRAGFYARKFPNWSPLWKASWKNTIVSCWSFSRNDS
jgi:hypothetical protein